MRKVLVTGATGFAGNATIKRLLQDGHYRPVAISRVQAVWPEGVETMCVSDLGPATDWSEPLGAACEADAAPVLIHLAARVHMMQETSDDPLAEFRRVNVEGTLNLAKQAADFGVRRFIFVSSIKVNGERTTPGKPYTADDHPNPVDPYGISKLEAERGLLCLAKETSMEVVIIRPVLVYGPGVKANFRSMIRWLSRGVPLPLGAIDNKRSLVALDNLVDLIVTCIDHPAAADQIFLVSDGEDLSTTELLQRMGKALRKPVHLIRVPAWLLKLGASLLGKAELAQRLFGSLQVDITKTRNLLGWSPPISVDEGLRRAAIGWQGSQASI